MMNRSLFLLLPICLLLSCGQPVPTGTPRPPTPEPTAGPSPTPYPMVTLDGVDPASGVLIVDITLWRDYGDRSKGAVAVAQHGQRVKLIKQEGDYVLVERHTGERGWLHHDFILELK